MTKSKRKSSCCLGFQIELETIRELTYEFFKNYLYTEECESWFSPAGFRNMFSLIGRNAQGIGTSPVSVWAEKCEQLTAGDKAEKKRMEKLIKKTYDTLYRGKAPGDLLTTGQSLLTRSATAAALFFLLVAGTFLNSEGCGLYELQSMCNHSCKPNAEISFRNNNHMLTLVTLPEIKPGEEICISYVGECQLTRSRHTRRKMLR